jgi:hypothetical protein
MTDRTPPDPPTPIGAHVQRFAWGLPAARHAQRRRRGVWR